jgi:hypothetical protein
MPSRGQPRVIARLPRELHAACLAHLASLTFPGDSSPPTMSTLIVEALIEHLHHKARNRGIRTPRPTSTPPDRGERRTMNGCLLAGDAEGTDDYT